MQIQIVLLTWLKNKVVELVKCVLDKGYTLQGPYLQFSLVHIWPLRRSLTQAVAVSTKVYTHQMPRLAFSLLFQTTNGPHNCHHTCESLLMIFEPHLSHITYITTHTYMYGLFMTFGSHLVRCCRLLSTVDYIITGQTLMTSLIGFLRSDFEASFPEYFTASCYKW